VTEAAAPRRGSPYGLTFLGGIAAVAAYLGAALVSYQLYPRPFGPLGNWLSDLGNAHLDLSGAVVYNVGVVLTGVGLLAFFRGIRGWSRDADRERDGDSWSSGCSAMSGLSRLWARHSYRRT
jgi:hypothetical protein